MGGICPVSGMGIAGSPGYGCVYLMPYPYCKTKFTIDLAIIFSRMQLFKSQIPKYKFQINPKSQY
jgi:hypothetical protein